MKFRPVTHVIFDMDGTLLDSEKIYYRLIKNVCAHFGGLYTTKMQNEILGRSEQEMAEILIRALQLKCSPTEWRNELHMLYAEELKACELMPGAEKLVRHLFDNSIPIAVATSSSRESIAIKTAHLKEFFQLFSHIVSGTSDDAIQNGKPAPDIFLYCASLFFDKPDPKNCLVLEDAPSGIQGAIAAEMQAVMIPAPELPKELTLKATLVISSLNDFNPPDFGLPGYNKVE